MKYRYPCTGHVDTKGFGAFLEAQLGAPRENLRAFGKALEVILDAPGLTLVNSGSSANLAAAFALREQLPKEKRVALIAGFTFPTTVSALLHAGFSVRCVDTEPMGFCMDVNALERSIDSSVGVVCCTNFLGFAAPLRAIKNIADAYGTLVLQDACESMNFLVNGSPLSRYATVTSWSFYHPHHLSSFGGGAVYASSPELQSTLESLVHWGRACMHHLGTENCDAPPGIDHNFWYVRPGFNLEMSELNACYGLWSLSRWEEFEAVRKRNYRYLYEVLQGQERLHCWEEPSHGCSAFVFPFAVKEGDSRVLAERLMNRGVEVRTVMGGAITNQPAYRALPGDGLRNCKQTGEKTLFVGIHQTLPWEDVQAVGKILREEAIR